jgi:cell division protein FtsW
LGFVGALAVLVLLATIIVTGFRTAQIAPDVFGSLLAAGISVWFLLQVFVNLGGVLGRLPITGVTLPFVSSGGTSLIVNAAAAGLLLNIARQSK